MTNRDWVTKRAACSIETAFARLRKRVEYDVAEANKLGIELRDSYTFEIVDERNSFGVIANPPPNSMGFDVPAVIFEMHSDGIQVLGTTKLSDRPLPTAPFNIVLKWDPSAGKAGKCLLVAEDEPLKLWQISHRALAGLFVWEWRKPETDQ